MRILIAEDDRTSRTVLMRVLTTSGHEVVETVNGLDALNAMRQTNAPRLAILDWIMPDLDGLEVIRRIRAIETDRPPYLIMLTSKGEKEDIIAGLEAGADDYISKPFNPGELRARVAVGVRMVEIQANLSDRVEELKTALAEIKTLSGLIPMCANCKKIRDDSGYWNQVETYISQHSDATFTHGICPECMKVLYPGALKEEDES